MTARDQLIAELHEALHINLGRMDYQYAHDAAVVCANTLTHGPAPARLLVDLAIDRGGLRETSIDPDGVCFDTETGEDLFTPVLYRMAER